MKNGLARLTLTAFVAAWALLGLISPAAAQDVDEGDVEDLAEDITDRDPQQVLDALASEFNADDLPDGFTEAVYAGGDGTSAAGDASAGPSPSDIFGTGDFEGAVGIVPFSVTPEESEDEEDDEAPAEGTLPVDLPASLQSFDFYAIYYIVFEDEEAATAALDEARNEQDEDLETEDHEDFGVPGISMSGAQSEEGASTALSMKAVQVGNVAVMGMAVKVDMSGEEPNLDEFKETARNLAEAGIRHLDQVVEDL